jgi:uncharacterized membrane protein
MKYPLKLSFKSEAAPLLLLIASFVLGFYFYAHFPDRVASHWGFGGQPDRYSGKFAGAFAIPFLLTGMYALFLVLPLLDPKSERYQDFAKAYNFFRFAILAVLAAVFTGSGLYNLGYAVNIGFFVPLVIGLMMIVMGNYMGKIKKNWFVGIRTPWTLSSENVWNKTHRFGGWMFMIFGLLLILTPFLPASFGLAAILIGVFLTAVVTMVYSYLEYQKEKKQNNPAN